MSVQDISVQSQALLNVKDSNKVFRLKFETYNIVNIKSSLYMDFLTCRRIGREWLFAGLNLKSHG